ncbi:MAG: AbrB/MazE/SpoVT family DNA-binding domain-containing protein [Burkholderiaceae bacterium]
MKLLVEKWGNSLAVRLPVEYARATGVKEGDTVDSEISGSGKITLTPQPGFDKTAFLRRARKLRGTMTMTSSSVDALRSQERY